MVRRLAHTLNLMRNSALFLPAWGGKKMRSTTDDDTIILEARTLFNGTIVGIERSEGKNACIIEACKTKFSW